MSRVFRFLFAAVAVSLLLGCRWEDPFGDYRDVNLIEDRGLSAADFTDAYLYDTLPVFDYINYDGTLAAADYGTTSGLPDGAANTIHRLEIYNLIPDGDFETSAVGSTAANWTPSANSVVPDFDVVAAGSGITGQSVAFSIAPTDYVTFDLNSTLLDGFENNAIYSLELQFIRDNPQGEIVFDYGNGGPSSYLFQSGTPWQIDRRENGGVGLETLPTPSDPILNLITSFVSSNTGNDFLYAGSALTSGIEVSRGLLDNVRLTRVDILPHVQIAIPDATGDQLPLVPGIYTFSVYVKSEIDSQVTPSAAGHNRFRAGQIALGANDDFRIQSQSDAGWDSGSWTRVSRTFSLSQEQLALDPPLTLAMSVSTQDAAKVGSLLIAAPTLELGDTTEE